MPSLYDTLGVSRGANDTEIKKAYRKLAVEHHPDKGGDAEKFKEVQKAYEILSDDQKRSIYDQTGREMNDAVQDHSDGIPFGGSPFGMPFGMPFDMGQMFGGMFGPRHGPPQKQQKAPPKIHELPLSLWDYYHGKQIRIQFERQKFCQGCKGSGAASYESCGGCGGSGMKQQMMMMGPGMNVLMRGPCDACSGEGKRVASACKTCSGKKTVTQEKALDIKIEPGMRPGEVLKFVNECSDQVEYLEPGDVHIHLQEADEAVRFKRIGADDLQVTTQIGLKDALLGCEEKFETHPAHPQGLVLEIPVGVQNGDVIYIEGEGMPRKGGRGRLHLTVQVVASAAEKELLVKGRSALEGVFTA
jgi:DnaJ family protein A protein 2